MLLFLVRGVHSVARNRNVTHCLAVVVSFSDPNADAWLVQIDWNNDNVVDDTQTPAAPGPVTFILSGGYTTTGSKCIKV